MKHEILKSPLPRATPEGRGTRFYRDLAQPLPVRPRQVAATLLHWWTKKRLLARQHGRDEHYRPSVPTTKLKRRSKDGSEPLALPAHRVFPPRPTNPPFPYPFPSPSLQNFLLSSSGQLLPNLPHTRPTPPATPVQLGVTRYQDKRRGQCPGVSRPARHINEEITPTWVLTDSHWPSLSRCFFLNA